MKALITKKTPGRIAYDHIGVNDMKGRAVGFITERFECDVIEVPEDTLSWWTCFDAPGHYFCAAVQVTRSGTPYGATQTTHYFKNTTHREVWIEARCKRIRRYNITKFGNR